MPVEQPALQARLAEILDANLGDTTSAWTLDADGVWQPPAGGDRETGAHRVLQDAASRRARPRID